MPPKLFDLLEKDTTSKVFAYTLDPDRRTLELHRAVE